MSSLDPSHDAIDLAATRWFRDLEDRGIIITDAGLRIRGWNRWLTTHTGYQEADVLGRHLLDVYPTLRERGISRYYDEALAGEVRVLSERLHKCLVPIVRNYHNLGVIEMSQAARIEPLTHEGRTVGTITVIEDVTLRVTTERELRTQIAVSEEARATAEQARSVAEEASRLKDEFLATLSHEMRTPLNAVLGWARILRGDITPTVRLHAVDVIERNSQSQLRIIEDLLDMARVMAGKLQVRLEPVDLRTVTQSALDVVAPSAKAKRITITTAFEKNAPAVLADADRLQQVAWNLLGNAVKFTPAGGSIDVRVAGTGERVRLTITDNGAGIDPAFLPHVFERFRQADGSTSRRYGGLGLGLALVRQIVELHGGSAGGSSEGIGRGATFWVEFPAVAAVPSQPARTAHNTTRNGVNLTGVTVLLVEDDRDSREVVTTLLEHCGATVHGPKLAREALELLRTGAVQPDILISDIGLPEMDGYRFLKEVRALGVSGVTSLPAVALTAFASECDRDRALLAGFNAHLSKPLEPWQLVSTIRALLRTDSL